MATKISKVMYIYDQIQEKYLLVGVVLEDGTFHGVKKSTPIGINITQNHKALLPTIANQKLVLAASAGKMILTTTVQSYGTVQKTFGKNSISTRQYRK